MKNNAIAYGHCRLYKQASTYTIDAFKSTLEESLTADLILLLIDSFEAPRYQDKIFKRWQVPEELRLCEGYRCFDKI